MPNQTTSLYRYVRGLRPACSWAGWVADQTSSVPSTHSASTTAISSQSR